MNFLFSCYETLIVKFSFAHPRRLTDSLRRSRVCSEEILMNWIITINTNKFLHCQSSHINIWVFSLLLHAVIPFSFIFFKINFGVTLTFCSKDTCHIQLQFFKYKIQPNLRMVNPWGNEVVFSKKIRNNSQPIEKYNEA